MTTAACPRCFQTFEVSPIVQRAEIVGGEPGMRQALIVSFESVEVAHRCPDPTRDVMTGVPDLLVEWDKAVDHDHEWTTVDHFGQTLHECRICGIPGTS